MEAIVVIVMMGMLARGCWKAGKPTAAAWAEWAGHRGRAIPWAEAAAGGHRGRVRLMGRTEAGPQGVLSSPLTNTPCVWWTVEGDEVRHRHASVEPFVIRGDGGAATVRAAPGRVKWAEAVGGTGKGGHRAKETERVLREGADVVVSGRPEAGPGGLVIEPDGLYLSTSDARGAVGAQALILALTGTFGVLVMGGLIPFLLWVLITY